MTLSTAAQIQAPVVSAIIPTYQRREVVGRAVDSVLAQTCHDWELIVVDDGSTDGTEEALAPLANRLRYHWQPNRGASAARNEGLRLARAPIVAFLDSDDQWLPNHLTTLVAALDEHPQATLAFSDSTSGRAWRPDGDGRLTGTVARLLIGNRIAFLSAVAVRRLAVIEVGGFDERRGLAEDADLWLRLAIRGCGFLHVPSRTLVKGATPESLLGTRSPGDYADALRLSTAAAIEELRRGGDDRAARWARGRLHMVEGLDAVRRSDFERAQLELRAACRKLPALSDHPESIVNHVRYNLAGTDAPGSEADQLVTIAGLWPDQSSRAARELSRQGLRGALQARRPLTALRAISSAPASTLAGLVGWGEASYADPSQPSASPLRRSKQPGAAVQQLMVRTHRGPLRLAWQVAYMALAHGVARHLRGADPAATAYLRGSLASGEPVFGLSDIDLAFVVSGDVRTARHELRRRWHRVRRIAPRLSRLFEPPQVYSERELRVADAHTPFTHGLGGGEASTNLRRRVRPTSRERRRERSGAERSSLYSLTADWRLIAGADRRPPGRSRDPSERRISAWMELQYWWLQAFRACAAPRAPWTAHLCAKLLNEPARIWLWLTKGERFANSSALVESAVRELPQEEEPLRASLELLGRLHRSPPAPLDFSIGCLARMSRLIAAEIEAEAARTQGVAVRLIHGAPEALVVPVRPLRELARMDPRSHSCQPVPLVDWRARVWSLLPDEALVALPAGQTDPDLIRQAAVAGNAGVYAALRDQELLVIPSLRRARLRAAQCPSTDPVSFALLAGEDIARFPGLPGWSAAHSAHRAAAEHLGWLRHARGDAGNGVAQLGRLLSAARAGLFLDSLLAGDPELALSVGAVGEKLDEALPANGDIGREAVHAYRAARLDGALPPKSTVAHLRRAVTVLPAYADQT